MPNNICELAIPRSASSSNVSLFCNAKHIERFTEMVVLPTPPLPEAIAIVVVIINPI